LLGLSHIFALSGQGLLQLEVNLLDEVCARAMILPVLKRLTITDPSHEALAALPRLPSLAELTLTVDSAEMVETFAANTSKLPNLTKLSCVCDRLWSASENVPLLSLPNLTTLKLETIIPDLLTPQLERLELSLDCVVGDLGYCLQSVPSLTSLSVFGCECFPSCYALLQPIREGTNKRTRCCC